jgi:tetratricopeptide (TPR) repeat protein
MRSRPRYLTAAVAAVLLLPGFILLDAASDKSDLAAIQLTLGDLLYDEGRYGDALRAFERAATIEEPRSRSRALSGLSRSAVRIAEFRRALEAAGDGMEIAPNDPMMVSVYGDALWATGRFEEAEQAYRDALALQPDLAAARHGLARSLAARSRLDDALAEAQTALGAVPREAEFHHTVGTINERLHRYEDAAQAFGNYLNLLPNKERSDKALLARTKVRFLRAFGGRTPLRVDPDPPDAVHVIPFRMQKDKVFVRARLNGGRHVEFILDTGAEQTVLARKTAERAGVLPIVQTLSAGVGETGLRGLQLGRIDRLEIGSLVVENVPCLIKSPSLGGLPTKERDSISPLALGYSMIVDYAKRQLVMARRLPDKPYETELPLRFQRLALVLGRINRDLPVNFIVDTGGEVISISESTVRAISVPPSGRRIPLKVYGISGWDRDAFLLPGIELEFSKIRFQNFPVVVLNLRAPSALLGFEVGGIVGHKFLSKYQVTIDVPRSVVRLNPAS